MSEYIPQNEQKSFDIKNYLLKLIVYWYLFVISITIAFSINYYNNRFAISQYISNSTIILKDELQTTQKVIGGLNLFDNRNNLENEIGILKSYSLTKKALEELDFEISYFKHEKYRSDVDLYKSSPFVVQLDSSKQQANYYKCYITILSETKYKLYIKNNEFTKTLKFGETFSNASITFKIVKRNNFKNNFKTYINKEYYFYKNDMISLIKSYKSRININLRSPNSSILWLWLNGTVKQRMIDYQNKLAKLYLQRRLDDKNKIVKNTINFIDSQLKIVVDTLSDVEDNLQGYKQTNQIIDISKEGEILFDELVALQSEKKMVKLKLNFYKYLKTNISEQKDASSILLPGFIDVQDKILNSSLEKLEDLKSKKEILEFDVKKDLPNYNKLEFQIKKIENSLTLHIDKSINLQKYNLVEVNKKTSNTYSQLRKIPKVEREIINIQRNYKLNDNIYSFLLKKRTDATITLATNSPGAKILDLARVENITKQSPKPGDNRTKLIFISLIIPILIIIIKEFFNNKIIEKSDIEKNTTVPIIASISRNTSKDNIPIFTQPNSPISEAFRLFKTNIKYLLIDKNNPIIVISSTISGEGKSFCSTNLSAIFAKSEKKTLLIGLDLRKPQLHKAFNNDNKIGLSTYLIGYNEIDEIIVNTEIENLFFIPSGPIPPNPAELIESEKMKNLLSDLKKQFDYIIIDTPPIAHVTDTMLIANYSDVNIFIVRQGYSSKNVLNVINEAIEKGNLKNTGILINDINQSIRYGLKNGYGFSYGFNYGYGAKDGQGYFNHIETNNTIFKKIDKAFYDMLSKIFS